MKNPTLVDLDGWAVVREEYDYTDKPEICVNYYPTGMRSMQLTRDFGIPVPAELENSSMGKYAVRTGRSMYGVSRCIALPELGATKCIKQEIVPVPCPKVRKGIETRWCYGRWEKYLQAKGWVTA